MTFRFSWFALLIPLLAGCPTRTVYYDGGMGGDGGGSGAGGADAGGRGGTTGEAGTAAGGMSGTGGLPPTGGAGGSGGMAGQSGVAGASGTGGNSAAGAGGVGGGAGVGGGGAAGAGGSTATGGTSGSGGMAGADGTCHDAWAAPDGRVWQKAAVGGTLPTSDGAVTYCSSLTLCGYHWKVPDIDDLRTLVRGCPVAEPGTACQVSDACAAASCWTSACKSGSGDQLCMSGGGPGANGCYIEPNLTGSCYVDWSSTQTDTVGAYWRVDFIIGSIEQSLPGDVGAVRCLKTP